MKLPFTKISACGNDFIIVDEEKVKNIQNLPFLVRKTCQRRFGIGADGWLLFGKREDRNNAIGVSMTVKNADGSDGENCGNGIRAIILYAKNKIDSKNPSWPQRYRVETPVGDYVGEINQDDAIELRMPIPRKNMQRHVHKNEGHKNEGHNNDLGYKNDLGHRNDSSDIGVEYTIDVDDDELNLSMVFRGRCAGNPHMATIIPEDAWTKISDGWIESMGKQVELDDRFSNRTNVEFIMIPQEQQDKDCMVFFQRTWERGSGETFACGTGATACVSIVSELFPQYQAFEVILKGGRLVFKVFEKEYCMISKSDYVVYEGVLPVDCG